MEIFGMKLTPETIWIITGILLCVIELFVPGLIIFFFGIGALVTGLICMIVDVPPGLQIILFVAISLMSLILLRKKFTQIFQGKMSDISPNEMEDEFVGKRGIVVKAINLNKPGKVDFRGTTWIAESDSLIEEDEPVEIISKKNITLTVKKI